MTLHDTCCRSCQGTFDGEVVKILKFYGDKKRELQARLDELQTDIDALPTQVTLLAWSSCTHGCWHQNALPS